jgi:hypothetical protein
MFNHIPISTPIMETAHEDNKHFYSINGEKYPSITTILHSFPNPGIDIWKSKTPNWREIQEESFRVGTNLHYIIEEYLKNTEEIQNTFDISEVLFSNLKPELDKINNIYCQETHLYEPNLKIAGMVDCIAEYDGVLSVVDFKNSRKPKKEWMVKKSGYYEQLTAYSLMFQHCTGIEVNQGVNLIANWDGSISVHKIQIRDYEDKLYKILERYYNI